MNREIKNFVNHQVLQVVSSSLRPPTITLRLVNDEQRSSKVVDENIQTDDDKDDPIAALKLRFAKGEISKKDMKKCGK